MLRLSMAVRASVRVAFILLISFILVRGGNMSQSTTPTVSDIKISANASLELDCIARTDDSGHHIKFY